MLRPIIEALFLREAWCVSVEKKQRKHFLHTFGVLRPDVIAALEKHCREHAALRLRS